MRELLLALSALLLASPSLAQSVSGAGADLAARASADPARATFGAKGDGLTNDTAALQAYADACYNGVLPSRTLTLKAGTYMVSDPGVTIRTTCNLVAEQGVTIKALAAMTGPLLTLGDGLGTPYTGKVIGLTVDADQKAPAGVWFRRFAATSAQRLTIRNITTNVALSYYLKVGNTDGLAMYGLDLTDYLGEQTIAPSGGAHAATSRNIWVLAGSTDHQFDVVQPLDAAVGMKTEGSGGGDRFSRIHAWNHDNLGTKMTTCFEDSTNGTIWRENYADGCTTYGWNVSGAQSTFLFNRYYIGAYNSIPDNTVIAFNFSASGPGVTLIGNSAIGFDATHRVAKDINIAGSVSSSTTFGNTGSNVVTYGSLAFNVYEIANLARASLTSSQLVWNTSGVVYVGSAGGKQMVLSTATGDSSDVGGIQVKSPLIIGCNTSPCGNSNFNTSAKAGELIFTKVSSPTTTAPGAGYCREVWTAGTTAGTAKKIAYCGTSATPVTVVDNVGGGF